MTSLYSLKFSHRATVDMLLCLFITSALYLAAWDHTHQIKRNTSWRWLGIYTLMSLSFLSKFHYGPVLISGPVIIYFIVQKKYSNLLYLLNPAGLFLFVCSVVIWPYLIISQIPDAWELWKVDAIARSFNGSEPVWFYFQYAFLYTLPWVPISIFALKNSWIDAWYEKDSKERFLWVWLIVQFAIISFSATKRSHYVIPVLPVFSLITAKYIVGVIEHLPEKKLISKKQALGISFLFLIAAVIIWWAITRRWSHLNNSALFLAVLFGTGSSLLTWRLHKCHYKSVAAAATGLFMGCYLIIYSSILPGMDRRREEASFAISVKASAEDDQSICAYKLGMDSAIYYLGQSTYRIEDLAVLEQQLENNSHLNLVTRRSNLTELSELGDSHILKKHQQPEGTERARKSPLMLVELKLNSK